MADILIVEDDESVLALLETNLLIKGHNVLKAGSAAECLSLLEKNNPNLIILDVMLPDADGIELLESIRERPDSEYVPAIILTARGDERDRVRGFAAGADDYLVKPFFATELLLRIDRSLNQASTNSSLRELALTDRVTGLGNRSYFETRLEQLRDRADLEDVELTLFVIDLPSLPSEVRKSSWKTADMVLAKLGTAIKASLHENEEAFWLGTGAVIVSVKIHSGDQARSRLEELKKVAKETLDAHRRQLSLVPYFGFCFYEPPETTWDLIDKAMKSPYGKTPRETPRESLKKSTERSVEAAFGGKLTGLAPVDYVPEEPKRRGLRSSSEQKIDKKLALSHLREIAAHLAANAGGADDSRVDEEKRVLLRRSGPQEARSATTTNQPIHPTEHTRFTLPRLEEHHIASALEDVLNEATSAPYDVAVCCLAFEGAEKASANLDSEAVLSLLDIVATQAAFEAGLDRYTSAQAFWTGIYLFVAVPSIGVPEARALTQALAEAAATKLVPHRLNLKVSPRAGYVFFDFEESPSGLIERAKGSPYEGGVLITPLQARQRTEARNSEDT